MQKYITKKPQPNNPPPTYSFFSSCFRILHNYRYILNFEQYICIMEKGNPRGTDVQNIFFKW